MVNFLKAQVFAVLKNLGIDYLDYIVATHADADHIGDIIAVSDGESVSMRATKDPIDE